MKEEAKDIKAGKGGQEWKGEGKNWEISVWSVREEERTSEKTEREAAKRRKKNKNKKDFKERTHF